MADDITLDAPETRIERFLAAAAGVDGITLDDPETRTEKYLYTLAQNVGAAEYWIPVEYHRLGYLIIPDSQQDELERKMSDPIHNLIRGINVQNEEWLPGYVSANEFIVPLSSIAMHKLTGDDCEGRIRISRFSDDDEYLVYVEPNKFIVTLTPTALDYSGTMDKTVAEINAAYEAGQEIWANISAQGKNLYIPLKTASTNGEDQYPSFDFCAYDIGDGLMILAFTAYTNDGTKQTYSTAIYSLTPAT
jgi:hypothetical protein